MIGLGELVRIVAAWLRPRPRPRTVGGAVG